MKRNALTVYVIQRKEDGLYFKSRNWQGSNWTDNMSKCRVFKSVSGAKTSRGWKKHKWLPCSKPNLCWNCKALERAGVGADGCNKEQGSYIKMTEEELPYRVVPVTLKVTRSMRLS